MALINAKFYSKSLGMQTEAVVVIPECDEPLEINPDGKLYPTDFKCLYLLHGHTEDQTIWSRKTSIERYATGNRLCVVMPSGLSSYYTDMTYGEKYYTYITEELPELMHEFFGITKDRNRTFIAGNSMGGYGALKIGLRNPDKYAVAIGLSAVTDIKEESCATRVFKPIFGDPISIPDEDNLFTIAKNNRNDTVKPSVYLCCGTEDSLLNDNERFKDHLIANGYEVTYVTGNGTHGFTYWDERILPIIRWLMSKKI